MDRAARWARGSGQRRRIHLRSALFFFFITLEYIELSDTKVYALLTRALLGTASQLCEVAPGPRYPGDVMPASSGTLVGEVPLYAAPAGATASTFAVLQDLATHLGMQPRAG